MNIKTLISVFTLLSIVFGGVYFVEDRYALAQSLTQLQVKVKLNELYSVKNRVLEEVFFLRGQIRKYPQDQSLIDQLLKAEQDLQDVKKKIGYLMERG